MDTGKGSTEESYHFITYVPINGTIYELDGLRRLPVIVGHYDENEDWLKHVRPVINERIAKFIFYLF